jgi:hypothetical protein
VRRIFLLSPALLLSGCLQRPPALDQDGDGYAIPEDCDDNAAEFHPGAEEIWYDGADQDCDGWSDYDQDGDGFDHLDHGGDDCDDSDAGVNPEAVEQYYDGIDQDCDGRSDFDKDRDGYDSEADGGGDDCDDGDPDIHPGATEVWYDGIDQNCDGTNDYDQDGDGHDSAADTTWGTDCDDTDDHIHPDATEQINGVDDDCDGATDEVPWAGGPHDVTWFHGGLVGEPSTFSGFGYAVAEKPMDVVGTEDLAGGTLDASALHPDMVADLLVSAPLAGFFGSATGGSQAVYLIPGGEPAALSGDDVGDRTVLRLEPGEHHQGWFGSSVAWVPSVDGDGVPEILVGAPLLSDLGTGQGAAYLFHSADWDQAEDVPSEGGHALHRLRADHASVTLQGQSSGDGFGAATCIGDIDGNFGADIAITLPNLGGDGYVPGAEPGAVAIFESSVIGIGGATGSLGLDDADAVIFGADHGVHLGYGLPVVTDLDGNGQSDMVVAAPGNDGDHGSVALWLGDSYTSGLVELADLDYHLSGGDTCQRVGQRLASGGDTNGDGYPELGVLCSDASGDPVLRVIGGASWRDNPDSSVQSVTQLWISGLELGTGVDTLPFLLQADFNQDGFADLVVGSAGGEPAQGAGLVSVFYGSTDFTGVLAATAGDGQLHGPDSSWMGYTTIQSTKLTADAWPELVLGGPGYDPEVVAGLHRPGILYLLDPEEGW